MTVDRRHLLTAAGAGLAAGPVLAAARPASAQPAAPARQATLADLELSLQPGQDAAATLQTAIDQTAARGIGLRLPPGTYSVGRSLTLRPGTTLAGSLGITRLHLGAGAAIVGQKASGLRLESLSLEGAGVAAAAAPEGLVSLNDCPSASLTNLELANTGGNGLMLKSCSGWVNGCHIHDVGRAAILSLDGSGLEIAHNHVHDCADNGILVWTSKPAECGTTVLANRIARIANKSGGSGQYGNGINVFRAAGVLVANNRVTDCAYTAIRGNAASNIQMIANSCARLGEVALYAEFGFEGALIANNLVETAASGIAVTNFNEGGRLAVVQGNLIRNLARREHEPEDKRGEAIAVEADSIVSANVIENAPTAGVFIGWGKYLREVGVSGNLIRNARIGIAVQADKGLPAGASVLIANNMISGAKDGAIRTLRHRELLGADLARATTNPFAHITVSGNVAT